MYPITLFQMLVALSLMAMSMAMMPRLREWAVIAVQLKR